MADDSDEAIAPKLRGYESWLFHRPSEEIEGEFFVSAPLPAIGDSVDEPPHRWLFAFGDIIATSEAAPRIKAVLKSELLRLVRTETDPARLLQAMNHVRPEPICDAGFATMLLAVLDRERHELTLAGAGSPGPWLRSSGGRVKVLGEDKAGFPLWVSSEWTYESVTTPIGLGDVVTWLSDGVQTIVSDQPALDDKQILRSMAGSAESAASVGQSVLEVIQRFEKGRDPQDEITLLCLGRIA